MKTHTTLSVELGDRGYPIYIGAGLLQLENLLSPFLSSQVLIVTNTVVAPLYLDQFEALIGRCGVSVQIETIILKDGESEKTLDTVSSVFDKLMHVRFNRKAVIIALGGGVVGDMAGFAAACYQRGVDLIQVPTTLLSQVDSSVGGKTGVNHPMGKNMIGAFYQPQAVFIDLNMLDTLPRRELAAGLAEIIKYGLIADADFFAWLESNIDKLNHLDKEALEYAIERSCEIKAQVVAQDELEGGIRAILNLGHTYGHAIETEMGYGQWLHGEAVAAGMVMACELSVTLGWLGSDVLTRAKELLLRAHLPVSPPEQMTGAQFHRHMSVDKKVLDGKVRLVLLKGLGSAMVTSQYDSDKFKAQLDQLSG